MTSTPPLDWTIDVHPIHAPLSLTYEANERERDALKRYVEIEEVTSFKAEARVTPLSAGRFRVTGTLEARAVQASVVDLTPVPAAIDEPFTVEFWPKELIADRNPESVSFEEEPPEAIVAGQIAIGAFLCELFSLSLDPYPRNEGDDFSWQADEKEARVTPFSELAKLRPKKG